MLLFLPSLIMLLVLSLLSLFFSLSVVSAGVTIASSTAVTIVAAVSDIVYIYHFTSFSPDYFTVYVTTDVDSPTIDA